MIHLAMTDDARAGGPCSLGASAKMSWCAQVLTDSQISMTIVIPLTDLRSAGKHDASLPVPVPADSEGPLRDARARLLHDLRISVTDRCNFRCVYCMPKDVFGREYAFLERKELLSLEEIARVAGVFAQLG